MINKQLLKWSHEGYAPQLIYDDNGQWAVSFDSFGMATGGVDCVFIADVVWQDTPKQAVMAAVDKLKHDQ